MTNKRMIKKKSPEKTNDLLKVSSTHSEVHISQAYKRGDIKRKPHGIPSNKRSKKKQTTLSHRGDNSSKRMHPSCCSLFSRRLHPSAGGSKIDSPLACSVLSKERERERTSEAPARFFLPCTGPKNSPVAVPWGIDGGLYRRVFLCSYIRGGECREA